ncbi:MAG: HAD family hydrolase [Tepidisphaeraceae bacterium]
MTPPTPLSRPRGLLLDMDGTLTEPMLDFSRIKREMGIGDRPILEALAAMSPAERCAAQTVLHRHEERAAEHSTLNPGCRELLAWLDANGIASALITRNSLTSVQTVLRRHGLTIDILITRDDGRYKPDPQPLRLACERLRLRPSEVWMVGDGQYDVEAGRAAGVRTMWVSHGRARPFEAEPWGVARDLAELLTLLRNAS